MNKNIFKYEPRCEKTCLRGFRPGPTQTRLCSHRNAKRLEISDLVKGLYYPCSANKGADQLRAFVFAYAKSQFSHDVAHIMLF